MTWYNPGGGAGVWDAAKVDTDLRNIIAQLCHATNERELYRSAARVAITSITRALAVATVTTTASHSLTTGHYVFIIGAEQSEYNGIFQVTVTGASTFTFAVTGTPVSPATGTIKYVKQSSVTSFTYDDEFNTKPFPTEADFDGLPLHQITQHERRGYGALTFTSLTNFATVATLTVSSTAGISTGDYVEVSGADQAEYNGVQQVTVTGGTTMTYTVTGSPASPATGTIVAKHHGRVTQSAGTATVRLIGHGLHTGHYVEMSGCTPSDYNGVKQVTVPSHAVTSITRSSSTATVNTNSAHGLKTNDIVAITGANEVEYNVTAAVVTVTGNTTFTYTVTGTPATPATGSPVIWDQSHFTFAIDSGVAALATGDIKVKTPAHMIYRGTYSGSTARMYCKEHGFSVGQWVEVVNEDSAHTSWRFWGPVTAISADEYFEITASGVATTDIGHGQGDTDVGFWANRVIGVRKPLREIQAAIEGLLTTDVGPGHIRFVEDSSPYRTNYTLSNLLGAGSYGSSWLSLMGRSVETVSDALLQMKEAVDLLVVMAQDIGTDIDFADVLVKTGLDANHEDSWDEAVAATPTSAGQYWLSLRQTNRSLFQYRVNLVSSRTIEYSMLPMRGDFVDGLLRFWQTHSDQVSQTAFTITDSDTDTFDADASLPTSQSLIELSKPESWFSGETKSNTYTTPEPSSHPFPALSAGEATTLSIEQYEALDYVGSFVCELVPGTHLTYG